MPRHPHPSRTDEKDSRGALPGVDEPRWPGAPPKAGSRTYFECSACGEKSTLCYRCSECGFEPSGKTKGGQQR